MRKKILTYLFFSIGLTSLLVSLVISVYSFSIIEKILDTEKRESIKLAEANLQVYYDFLLLIEKEQGAYEKNRLKQIVNDLKPFIRNKSINAEILREKADKFGYSEIYLINRDGKIFETTFAPDKNLNLFSIGTNFQSYVESMFQSEKVFTHKPNLSMKSGILFNYLYYGPRDLDVVLEVSIRVKDYLKEHYEKDIHSEILNNLFVKPFKEKKYISSIDIITASQYGVWSFVKDGSSRNDIDYSLLKSLDRNEEYTLQDKDIYKFYKRIGGEYSPGEYDDSVYVEFVYDFKILNSYLKKAASFTFGFGAFLIIASLLIFGYLFEMRFIKRILIVNNGINQIREGNYETQIHVSGKDEITDIARNINRMKDTIVQRERDLRYYKNYLYQIIDSMPSVIAALNSEDKVAQINSAFRNYFNVETEEVLGKSFFPYVDFSDELKEIVSKSRKNQKRYSFNYSNDSGRYLSVEAYPVFNKDDTIVVRIDDLTEKHNSEVQLQQAQKMELVGVLAGGFAHNLNNVLSGITGAVSLMSLKLKDEGFDDRDYFFKMLNLINKSSSRAEDMARQMLTLSKKHQDSLEAVDISDSITQVIEICRNTFDKSVSIKYDSSNIVEMPVRGIASDLEQLFLNLMINAYHAMTLMKNENPGGVIEVVSERVFENLDETESNSFQEKQYWKISILDEGPGISDENLKKIFTPFFTTKESGLGTGLGLLMVENIVKMHSGKIEVKNRVEGGAAFSVFFPVLENVNASETVLDNLPEVIQGAFTGSVIIVDDEEDLRKTASEMFSALGFSVVDFSNGTEALLYYKDNYEKIDYVVLDMIMPVKNGKDVFLEMKNIYSDVKAILSSGYTASDSVDELLKEGFLTFLKKPYTLEKLYLLFQELESVK